MRDVNILKNYGVDVEKSLELLGDMEMYDEVMNDFLSMIDNKISLLEKYKSINDMNNYAIEVHSLKSDVRYLGFLKLGDLAYELELKSKANDLQGVSLKHDYLISEVRKCIAVCKSYLNNETVKTTNNTVSSNSNIEFSNYLDVMSQAIVLQSNNNVVQNTNEVQNKDGIILIVDDSQIVANFVKKVFENRYEVIIANDGNKAIELCSNDEIRLKIKTCLLDLNMPNVDGFAVLDYFSKNNYFVKLPVVVISGVENRDVINRARSYPIIDVLEKPFNERDVEGCVNKCLAAYF